MERLDHLQIFLVAEMGSNERPKISGPHTSRRNLAEKAAGAEKHEQVSED